MTSSDRMRVVIAGGGVAGLETLLAVQALAEDRVAITMLAPERHFTHRPLSVTEPFRSERPERIALAAIAADRGIELRRDAVARVDADARVVETLDGGRLPYDALVLALGARPAEAVRGAVTFRGSRDAERVRTVVHALHEGTSRSAAFVVPPGTSWALPLYELALQTARAAPGAALHLVTPEPGPLAVFGPEASEAVGQLLADRGIRLRLDSTVDDHAEGRLWLASGDTLAADHVVALPRLLGPHVRGIPSDPLGFVPVDDLTRVLGASGVHAVGDIAAHGIKQGGLAAQQADVAAQVIAQAAGAAVDPVPYRPVLRAMLLTGDGVRYLRHEPGERSELSHEPLWWPPHKVAGRHLAHYLARQAAAA